MLWMVILVGPRPSQTDRAGRQDRIDEQTADAFRMIAHQAEREIGAIGQAVDVPLLDLEGFAQVRKVGSVFRGVEVGQIDSLTQEAIMASLGRCDVNSLVGIRIVRQKNGSGESLIDFGTV
jgi:hypothetical protein